MTGLEDRQTPAESEPQTLVAAILTEDAEREKALAVALVDPHSSLGSFRELAHGQ
jgi:hypothetical protein